MTIGKQTTTTLGVTKMNRSEAQLVWSEFEGDTNVEKMFERIKYELNYLRAEGVHTSDLFENQVAKGWYQALFWVMAMSEELN